MVSFQGFIYRHLARKEDLEGIHAVYEMGNELGKGTFATVMKAIHKETGDWYAVKIIHNAKIRGPQTQSNMAAFEREVRILGELEHPNVCKFKEVFWGNGDDDTCERCLLHVGIVYHILMHMIQLS